MIGNRVRLILSSGSAVTGVLHKLDERGIVIERENTLPEGRGFVFFPMHRIQEIVDLGRVP